MNLLAENVKRGLKTREALARGDCALNQRDRMVKASLLKFRGMQG